ncbi:MAG: PqqD family protein [Anaerolineae bacterium]
MVELTECYRHDPAIVSREVAGEVILVPIRDNVGDLESIYTLNETAARVWALLDGERTLAEVRDAMVAEFEVEAAEAEADLLALVERLVGVGALQSCGGA